MLDQPTIEQSQQNGQNLGSSNHHFIAFAHRYDHVCICGAIHGTGLLGKELFNQCRNRVDHKNQTKRADQMAQDLFLG